MIPGSRTGLDGGNLNSVTTCIFCTICPTETVEDHRRSYCNNGAPRKYHKIAYLSLTCLSSAHHIFNERIKIKSKGVVVTRMPGVLLSCALARVYSRSRFRYKSDVYDCFDFRHEQELSISRRPGYMEGI